jgi:hypothetical protein
MLERLLKTRDVAEPLGGIERGLELQTFMPDLHRDLRAPYLHVEGG